MSESIPHQMNGTHCMSCFHCNTNTAVICYTAISLKCCWIMQREVSGMNTPPKNPDFWKRMFSHALWFSVGLFEMNCLVWDEGESWLLLHRWADRQSCCQVEQFPQPSVLGAWKGSHINIHILLNLIPICWQINFFYTALCQAFSIMPWVLQSAESSSNVMSMRYDCSMYTYMTDQDLVCHEWAC